MDNKMNPPMLFSKEKIKLAKSLYGGENNENLQFLREVFLPSLLDSKVPIEFGANDMWMDIDFKGIPNEEVKSIVLARQDTIKWIIGSLLRLKNLANTPDEETPQEREVRLKKDSLK